MNRHLCILIGAFIAAGCHGPSGPGGPEGSSSADMLPHDLPVQVDFPSWIQGADDFIEGTVVEIRASWSPLVHESEGQIAVDDCASGHGALDLVLEEVRTLGHDEALSSMTVRVGLTGGLDGFNVPEVEWGSPVVQGWHGPAPTFTEGMRVGGPIYRSSSHPDPFFPTGVDYPIYRVMDGLVRFMVPLSVRGAPYETVQVDHLQDLSPEALWVHVIQASREPFAPLAHAYRDFKGFEGPQAIEHVAGRCSQTVAEAQTAPPCEDTGDLCP